MQAFNLSSRIKQVYNKVFLGLRFAQPSTKGGKRDEGIKSMCEVDDHDRPGSKLVKQGKEGLRELVWTREVVRHTGMALRGRGAVLEQGSLSQEGAS